MDGYASLNPYKLTPFLNNRLNLGESIDQSIVIHNPFDSVLHIREVFTTEDFLSLKSEDLTPPNPPIPPIASPSSPSSPSYVKDVARWEVSPASEREIINLNIAGSKIGKFTGYVHVKTDKDNVVVPVEIEVVDKDAVEDPTVVLDFGVLTDPTQ